MNKAEIKLQNVFHNIVADLRFNYHYTLRTLLEVVTDMFDNALHNDLDLDNLSNCGIDVLEMYNKHFFSLKKYYPIDEYHSNNTLFLGMLLARLNVKSNEID